MSGVLNLTNVFQLVVNRFTLWLVYEFLLHSEGDEIVPGKVSRALALQKLRYPNPSQIWYLEKIIDDLRDRNPL